MRGKIVNVLLGFLNLMVGIMVFLYTVVIPVDITTLTVQENDVVDILKLVLYGFIGATSFINLIGFIKNRGNDGLKFGYKLFLFTLSFIFIKQPFIALIPIFSALVIIKNILKENIRELESTVAISVIIVFMCFSFVFDGAVYGYEYIGDYILKKKNENQIAYTKDFFKYITELENEDIYINVKKDGKFGYVDTKGVEKIPFEYDYASPFTTITAFDKNFQVALVCKDGISQIIMKNGRVVKSYVSETSDENYKAKLLELKSFYKNEANMDDDMYFEVFEYESFINTAPAYIEKSENYTYKYDYNQEYDLMVTQSVMGFKDTYILSKKSNPEYQVKLSCDYLDYDEKYLYLYRDGTIPFFDVDKKEQGWFSPRGVKKPLKGNAQILEKLGNVFLYKDYNNFGQIVFVNQDGVKLSESYKEVYIQDDRYIVKKANDKYSVIGTDYKPLFEGEYDYVDTSLLECGIYLMGKNESDVIEFNDYNYANLNFTMLDFSGKVLQENLQQVYSNLYDMKSQNNKTIVENYNDFVNDLEKMHIKYVGDKFYNKQ